MFLERALELTKRPLEASKSHEVKVDRHALAFVLKNREETLTLLKHTKQELENTKQELERAKKKIEELTQEVGEALKKTK